MGDADTYVRARVNSETKQRASDALDAMGLSISDAIRMLILRIAEDKRLPFEVNTPSQTSREATAELEAGAGKRFKSMESFMADLHADD